MAKVLAAAVLVESIEVRIALEEEELLLRLELFRQLDEPNLYSGRVWRIESYRLQSSFPQRDGKPEHHPSDEVILKEFEGFEALSEPTAFSGQIEARAELLRQLSDWASQLRGPADT